MATLPHGASPHPAVLLIQGLDCASIDPPSGLAWSYVALLNSLDAAGFATVRVDKSGMGASSGPACPATDFATDVAGFRAALRWMRTRGEFDSRRLYLFGHSVGGMIAPMIAGEDGVAGVVVYGADPTPWRQYEVANARRQWALQGLPPNTVEARASRWTAMQNALYDQQVGTAEVRRRYPEFRGVFDAQGRYQGRTIQYFRQLATWDGDTVWRAVTRPVLVVAGDSDPLSDPADQARTRAIVASAHPGQAWFVRVPCADHWFRRLCSPQQSLSWTSAGPFNESVADAVVEWLSRREMAR